MKWQAVKIIKTMKKKYIKINKDDFKNLEFNIEINIEEDKIHKHLETDEIYDKLRQAHSLVKDIVYMDDYEGLTEEQKNAIDAIHSVLYLAEEHFTDF